MKSLVLSGSIALAALLTTALPAAALPPIGLSSPAQALHQNVHYRSLRPWHETTEDRYCRRRAERICNRVYRSEPDESHTRYLQRNYCTTDVYEECALSRQIGNLGSYSRH